MTDPQHDLLDDVAAAKFLALHRAYAAAHGEPDAFALDLLREYADAFALRRRAVGQLRAGPIVVRGSNGNDFPHPALKVLDQASGLMDRCLRRLRERGGAAADAAARELAEFLG